MTKRAIWLTGVLIAGLAIAAIALMGAQSNVTPDATIQDILNLLMTEDGQSRLAVIEGMLEDIDNEVDLIHAVAEQMLEDQYGFFATEEWNISDIKHQLDLLEMQIDCIADAVCSSP